MSQENINHFHAHLDDCRQCRDNPFDLCPIGVVLINEAAFGRKPPPFPETFKIT